MARIELVPGEEHEPGRVFRHAPWVSGPAAALSAAVYEKSKLPVRLRELMRMRIAQINHCRVCLDTRAAQLAPHGLSEELYANVARWRTYPGYTDAERIAIEYAEKFAADHLALDDAFFQRLRRHYSDEQIVEISVCVGTWLMMGRITMLMGVDVACPLRLPLEEPAA